MARRVSFYGPGQQITPAQQDYRTDPRRRLEETLLANGTSTAPVQSAGEGIARALQAGIGGYFQGQAKNELKEREAKYSAGMQKALQAAQPQYTQLPAGVQGPPNQISPGGTQGIIQALQSEENPDLLPFLQQMQLQQVQEQNDAKTRAEEERAARARYLFEQNNKAPTPDKYGSPYVIADPKSSTGYSRVRSNQAGDDDVLGEAPAPRKMFDPDAPRKEAQYKATSGRYEDATARLTEADTVISDVNQMLDLVSKVDSGTFADTKLAVSKMAAAAGFDVDMSKIATAEAMKSKGMDFVLQRIAKTKGAISEKEMKAFKEASAGLENTPEGNEMILALSKNVASRIKAEAEAVREAYGNNPDISLKELDDVRIAARQKFGDLTFAGTPVAAENPEDPLGMLTPDPAAAHNGNGGF